MKKKVGSLQSWFLPAIMLLTASAANGQSRDPHVGYVYPAGARQGTTVEVLMAGQFLDGVTNVLVSGEGVTAKVTHYRKPLNNRQLTEFRDKLKELRDKNQAAARQGRIAAGAGTAFQELKELAAQYGFTVTNLSDVSIIQRELTKQQRRENPQISESVWIRIEVEPDASPGRRELRLGTGSGVTNPLFFQVGQLSEHNELEPNDKKPDAGLQSLPATINGQIMPGDVDRFRFRARADDNLVVMVQARDLIPYLADAVPGWFQATVALHDEEGAELAFVDDFQFRPDPVMHYRIPADGDYTLEIRDSIYRGREDFVYRVAIGELPFITGVYPLGGPAGAATTVSLEGWNLPSRTCTLPPTRGAGPRPIVVEQGGLASNPVMFNQDTLPETVESEPNNSLKQAQKLREWTILNGRIDQPGDLDVFTFEGRAGEEIIAEVEARRLGSPLDSVLRVFDSKGNELATNDDCEDRGCGLITHHADSRVCLKLPADGRYGIELADAQHAGGTSHAYRLRISPPRPDFALRVVPSCINTRPGTTVPIRVHALRRDGFNGDILLRLKDAPKGFTLNGAWVPAGQDDVRLTLTVPAESKATLMPLQMEGVTELHGMEICRPVIPADDLMQAFIYRHLVPAEDFLVSVTGTRRFIPPVEILDPLPLQIPLGGSTQVHLKTLAGRQAANLVDLEASDPPEGIAIGKMAPGPQGLTITIRTDAEKVQPGMKGNLIFEAFMQRRAPAQQTNAPAQRWSVGSLPAIPFEVVSSR